MGLGLRHQETDADLFIEDENGVVLGSSERSGTANEWASGDSACGELPRAHRSAGSGGERVRVPLRG